MMISKKVRKPQKMVEKNSRAIRKTRNQIQFGEIQVETEIESQNEEGNEEPPKGQAIKENESQMSRSDQLKDINV